LYDCEITKHAAQDYLDGAALNALKLALDPQPGGGANTERVLEKRAIQLQKICICVVDSDRDEPSPLAPLGGTAQKCTALTGQGIYEIAISPGRELENHLPSNLINKVRDQWNGKSTQTQYTNITTADQRAIFFLDLKKGLKLKDIDDMTGAAKAFWDAFYKKLNNSATCCTGKCAANIAGDCKHTIVAPLGRTLLRDACAYLENNNFKRQKNYLPSPNDAFWRDIGEKVASYGVATKVQSNI
jgi:hypothetical protein